jgi:hypothetical protein
MRSISAGAVIALLVAGIADLALVAAYRSAAQDATTTGELFAALDAARLLHRLAFLVALAALIAVAVALHRAPWWCRLLWVAFVARAVAAYVTAPEPPPGYQALWDDSQPPTAGLRRSVLGELWAMIPVPVDALGVVLLAAAAAGLLFVVLRRVPEAP